MRINAQAVPATIPSHIETLFSDTRVVRVVEYRDGWVPNSYRWPAPGASVVYTRHEDGRITSATSSYDRKRSMARGPRVTAFSARGGRLASI